MIIEQVHVENFRALKDVHLVCEPLTALLGINNAGKSSLLKALEVFFNVAAKVSPDDYYAHQLDVAITIRLTFGCLNTDEEQEFASYIHDGKLVVAKVISSVGAGMQQRYFGATMQVEEFATIRNIPQKGARLKAYRDLAASDTFAGLPATAASADVAEQQMAAYERDHPELLRIVEREKQFLGPRNIGGGTLDKYTAFVFVPAVREASGETERKGAIAELINMIVMRRVSAREDVRQLRADFEARVQQVYSEENLTELSDLGIDLSQTLARYAPGAKLDLAWGEPAVPEIQLPPPIARLVQDDFPTPISHSGHGVQRALILTLLQELALAQHTFERPAEEGASTNATPAVPDLIIAIEEPELYLHPLRSRHLSSLLLELTATPAAETAPRNQIVYATHSPYFVDLQRFDQVRVARRMSGEALAAPCCEFSRFSLDEAAERLAVIAERPKEEFSRESFKAHATSVMSTEVSEGFFAAAVVVVEGASDAAALQKVQEITRRGWDARGIAVVAAGGKENIDRPVVIFAGLGLPVYFVFDGDESATEGRKRAQAARRNGRYLRLAGADVVDFPPTQVNDSWAVFGDELETEMKIALGDEVFIALRAEAAENLGYTKESQVLKSPEGMAQFIQRVYDAGKSLPLLEDLVAKVSAIV